MVLMLYYDSNQQPWPTDPVNQGFDQVKKLLTLLQAKGIRCEIIDTAKMTDEEVQSIYIEVSTLASYKKFRVRRVFGSRKLSGYGFGKTVPALLVYGDEGGRPLDVYPHEELTGKTVTIEDFLRRLEADPNL